MTMLSTFPKEAQGIRKGCDANGGVEVRGWGVKGAETIKGRPVAIVSTFADAFASLRSRQGVRFDLVILAVPAPHHEHYLQGLAPYLRKSAATDARETPKHWNSSADSPDVIPTILCAAVAQGGFDMAARQALSDTGMEKSFNFGEVIVAGLETLPWACRVARQGAVCEILGTKDSVDAAVAVFPFSENLINYAKSALQTLQIAVGPTPKLKLASGFLGVALSNVNAFWHPTLMWHKWCDWDGGTISGPAPLLYENAPDDLACDAMSAEVDDVVAAIKARYPATAGENKERKLIDDLSSARGVHQWFLGAYGDEPGLDTTSTATMMRTNPAYRGLTHPMRPGTGGDESSVPDFHHRYITEDVGFGLVVIRGIAELCGVATPTIDTVIVWAQSAGGLSFLTERGGDDVDEPSHPVGEDPGEARDAIKPANSEPRRLTCSGADLTKTRCPQRFGWFDLELFMQINGYAFAETETETETGTKTGTKTETKTAEEDAKDTPATGETERQSSANAA